MSVERGHRDRGLSLLEGLTVLVIILLVAAMAYPLVGHMKRRAQINSSIARLRQIHVAIEVYRQSYGGADVFESYESYYALGLPTYYAWNWEHMGILRREWESPCGYDDTMFTTAPIPSYKGLICYVAPSYEPSVIKLPGRGNGNAYHYKEYIATYRENVVLAVDPYCNPTGTSLAAPLIKKRGLAVLLSGQIVNKFDTGVANILHWYSEPSPSR